MGKHQNFLDTTLYENTDLFSKTQKEAISYSNDHLILQRDKTLEAFHTRSRLSTSHVIRAGPRGQEPLLPHFQPASIPSTSLFPLTFLTSVTTSNPQSVSSSQKTTCFFSHAQKLLLQPPKTEHSLHLKHSLISKKLNFHIHS